MQKNRFKTFDDDLTLTPRENTDEARFTLFKGDSGILSLVRMKWNLKESPLYVKGICKVSLENYNETASCYPVLNILNSHGNLCENYEKTSPFWDNKHKDKEQFCYECDHWQGIYLSDVYTLIRILGDPKNHIKNNIIYKGGIPVPSQSDDRLFDLDFNDFDY